MSALSLYQPRPVLQTMVVRWRQGARAKVPLAALMVVVLLAAPLAILAAQPVATSGDISFASASDSSGSAAAQPALLPDEAHIDVAGPDLSGILHRFEPASDRGSGGRFVAYTADGLVLLTDDALVPLDASGNEVSTLRFLGVAADHAAPVGVEQRAARTFEYLGNDPAAWRIDVPHFGMVRYAGLWPGVDLVVRLDPAGHLEFDHVAAPGADLSQIRLAAPDATIAGDGSLLLGPAKTFLQAPVSFDAAGAPVASRFLRNSDGSFGYEVGARDLTLGLTIDPVLRFETYSGRITPDANHDVAVAPHPTDSDLFRIYVAGEAQSGAFPTGFGSTSTYGPSSAMVAAQLVAFDYDPVTHEATPFAVVHYGGSLDDRGLFVGVDPNGAIILAGETASTNIPVLFPVQGDVNTLPPTYTGGAKAGGIDWFVVRFTSGFVIDWGTYVGGGGDDFLDAMAIDAAGTIALLGHGQTPPGPKFPTKNAYSDTPFGMDDVLLAVVEPNVSPPVFEFSTYLGDAATDLAGDVAMDLNRVWVGMSHDTATGLGTAGAMATPGAFMPFESTNPPEQGSALVMRINRAFPFGFEWATYLGGSGYERVTGLLVNAGRVWVAGTTTSADFPTCDNDVAPVPYPPPYPPPPAPMPVLTPCPGVPVLQRNFSEGPTDPGNVNAFTDGFVAQISPDGSQVLYSSYISTKLNWADPDVPEMTMERPVGLVRDPLRGHIVVLGTTNGGGPPPGGFEVAYPTYTAPSPPAYPAPVNPWPAVPSSGGVFLLRFQPGVSPAVPFSSFYIADGADNADPGEMAIDLLGNLYLTSRTDSDLSPDDTIPPPTFQGSYAGGFDGTISIIGVAPPTTTLRALYATDPPVLSIQDDEEDPFAVGNLPVMVRNTGELVSFDVVGSYPGDYPLATANYLWWMYDGLTMALLDDDAASAVPAFSPATMTYQGERIVCAEVRDNGVDWHPDGGDRQCVRIVFNGPPPPGFEVKSTAFSEGGDIPMAYTCDGSNVSPPVHFSLIPAGTTHLALQVIDLDAGGYVHWMWWDLPVSTPNVPGDATPSALGITLGENGQNDAAYIPFCPLDGEHTYQFRGFALDTALGLPPGSSMSAMNSAMSGHILDVDTHTGIYERLEGASGGGLGGQDDDEPSFIDPADAPPMPGSEASFTEVNAGEPQIAVTANAGPKVVVASGAPVVLDGTGSLSAASFQWRQVGASTVTLQGAASAKATFAAPTATSTAQSLRFELTVTDKDGATSTDEVDVSIQPSLSIIASDPEVFTKTFRSNQAGLLHTWDFGDGTVSSEQAPKHRYEAPGKYTVKLTVAAGMYTASAATEITVTDDRARDPPDTAGNGMTAPTAAFPVLALLALVPGLALVVLAVYLTVRRRGPKEDAPGGPPGPGPSV